MSADRKITTSDIAAATDRRDAEVVERERLEREHLDRTPSASATPQALTDAPAPLFADDELDGYRTRWSGIQTGFVDEPRRAVEEADSLVAELMQRLADGFANERRQLEAQWEKSDRVSTEDLRIAMRRYRSFFERLLTI